MNKFQLNSKRVISIAEQQVDNDLFMVIDFVLNDTLVNLNSIQYSEAFLLDIEDRSDEFSGIPLKVDFNKLIAGKTDKLTHNFNKKTKTFTNQMIGSFVKFYTQRNSDDVLELCGQVKIPKEFEKACEVIQQLYDDQNLNVSYEIAVGESAKIDNDTVTYVDKSPNNYLFAYSIVSTPAVVSAKAMKLCAELINSDITQSLEGGENQNMARNKETFNAEEMFANAKINLAEINIDQVRKKIYSQLKTKLGDDYWMYDCTDLGVDYMVLQNYSTGDLIKLDYSVTNNEVTLSEPYSVDKTYIKKSNTIICPNCDPNCPQCQECNQKEEDLMAGSCKKTVAELEVEVANLTATIESNKIEIASINEKLVAKETALTESNSKVEVLSASVITKDTELVELNSIKVNYDTLIAEKTTVENEAKKTALKDKYSKLLSAEVMAKVEIAEAIEKLDEVVLKDAVVEIAMASAGQAKPKNTFTASRITDNVSIGKNDKVSKFVTIQE